MTACEMRISDWSSDVCSSDLGSICCGHDGHRGWLYAVAVDPDRQHRGIGTRLVRQAEDWLDRQGILKIALMVRETNRKVLGFYAALGYAVTPRAVMARWLRIPATQNGRAPV